MRTKSSRDTGAALERRLLKSVISLLRDVDPALTSSPIVVAVSGGPDSMALLLLLAQLGDARGLTLQVAHLDHGLRGSSAQSDARFVEETARGLGLSCTLGTEDVMSYRTARGLSLEEAARDVRYTFLSRVAAERGARAVALGHTSDDQAETILMHILRGSGLTGLAGMSPISYRTSHGRDEGVALLRPLLDATRSETAAYCLWKGVTPREDETNRSLGFARNRTRLELFPFLENYNPRIREALLRLGSSAALDQDYMLREAQRALDVLVTSDDNAVRIEREGFSSLHAAQKRGLLRLIYQSITGSTEGLEHSHIESMVGASGAGSGKSVDLPGNLVFSVGYESLILTARGKTDPDSHTFEGEYALSIPGDTRVPGWTVATRLVQRAEGPMDVGPYSALLDAERAGGGLYVRGRRPGDAFTPLGMSGSRKLQDFMVDSKIPAASRDSVPLVASERGIAWVVGHRIADWAKVREETREVLEISFTPAAATEAPRASRRE